MITIYHWHGDNKETEWLEPQDLRTRAEELRKCPGTLWIDLAGPDAEEEKLVLRQFHPVHTLTVEDMTRLRREPDAPHFPKVEEFRDYLFVVINPLKSSVVEGAAERKAGLPFHEEQPTTQLSAILTNTILITHHYEAVPAVSALRRSLNKHEAQAERGPDYLFHQVLDAMVDEYAPVLDRFDGSLDQIENQVFGQPTQDLLIHLLQLKRSIITLRKTLVYEREVLARMSRGEFALIAEREMVYYRNVYDHLVRFTELIEASREMVTDLMQTHLSAASHKLNEIMKVLTMISTVVLPMTLIAGIYGMNFEHNVVPAFQSAWGFPLSLSLMALTGIAAFFFFRWQKWI